jgi:hypothetical protein
MMIGTAQLLSLVIGIVLPVVVAAVTRYAASDAIRAVVLAALAGATAVLTEWGRAVAAGDAFVWQVSAFAALGTFIVAVSTYFGLWKPTGVAEAVKLVPAGFVGGRHAAKGKD